MPKPDSPGTPGGPYGPPAPPDQACIDACQQEYVDDLKSIKALAQSLTQAALTEFGITVVGTGGNAFAIAAAAAVLGGELAAIQNAAINQMKMEQDERDACVAYC